MAALLLATLSLTPRRYDIKDRTLTVRTLVARFRYDLTRLSGVRTVSAREVFSGGYFRLFGSGSLFGFYGIFRNANLGIFVAFVTNRRKLVLLQFGRRSFVVSPEAPDAFLRGVQEAAPHSYTPEPYIPDDAPVGVA